MSASLAVNNAPSAAARQNAPTPFVVIFVTKSIAPNRMPDFVYLATTLHHDKIEFTAQLHATSLDDVRELVTMHWPDSTVIQAQMGGNFEMSGATMNLLPMGLIPHAPPPAPIYRSRTRRVWDFFFSTKNFAEFNT